jgi:SpoIID/LytB domain protein
MPSIAPFNQPILWLTTLSLLGLPQAKMAVAAEQPDVPLQIGIVQRFGDKPKDVMTLKAPAGDRLTLRFTTRDKTETLTTPTLKIEIIQQPLPEPEVQERVVFSTHRSFESAEFQAQQWQAKGISVELAQPEQWQVWAQRSVYKTPLVRRLLLQSLQAQGIQSVRIESKLLPQKPRPSWVVNGFRYTRDEVEITSGTGLINVDRDKDDAPKRLYPGSLKLQPNAYGNYSLVNLVPLEAYLRGVVPHEIGQDAPGTAMQAQAILARTYVLRNLRRFTIDNYQLCATTQCQVYWGLNGADPVTDQAIATTRGLVLTYNNELVDALYFSTSGGVTAPFNEVWQGVSRPYLRTVLDSVNNVWDLAKRPLSDEENLRSFIKQNKGFNEDSRSLFRWREEASLATITKDLQTYLRKLKHPLAKFKQVQQLQVTRRSTSGRVLKVVATTDLGVVELDRDDILNAFSTPISMLFYLDPLYHPNKTLRGYAFVGGGWGHGVGLSQFGAHHLGKLGWTSDRILAFYFPGTQLQPFNSAITIWRDPSAQANEQKHSWWQL